MTTRTIQPNAKRLASLGRSVKSSVLNGCERAMKDHLVQAEVLSVKARFWLAMIVLSFFVSGCGAPPMNYVLSEDTKKSKLDADKQRQVASTLEDYFGTPVAPKIADSLKPLLKGNETTLAQGAASYRLRCMHCHGLSGDGHGPTAPYVLPLPRDYRKGIFKFTSTDQTANPTRDDLLHTVKNGISGTSMPSFALFEQQEIENILDYVILLSVRGQSESFFVAEVDTNDAPINRESLDEQAIFVTKRWIAAESKVVKPKVARTEATAESIDRGHKLFISEKTQCTKCHGKQGRGDGLMNDPHADPKDTKDSWGNIARPANLTLGVYRGGSRPLDLSVASIAASRVLPCPLSQRT